MYMCCAAIILERREMESILQADLKGVRAPLGGDRVYKDECIYSFQTPDDDGGLYISLSSFVGLGPDHLALHHRKTGEAFYLHITRVQKPPAPKPVSTEGEAPPAKKPTRLALGVEGGFDGGAEPEIEWEEFHEIVMLPSKATVLYPNPQLPHKVTESVDGILTAQTASTTDAIVAWEGDKRMVSKLADGLKQIDNGVKIPPSGWKCCKCDLTTNLWLNLTDGAILCGRKYFDGSGGNNHAMEHYEQFKYPLAVKLGTITPSGADVYSYAEDDMMEDPLLEEHLRHFGINIAAMTKTDATMTELEIEANIKFSEWSILQESGHQLVPCYGAGYTGLTNLGNSCYLNSVMQILFSIPEFQKRFFDRTEEIFTNGPSNAPSDFTTQMCKLSVGLLSGRYSKPPNNEQQQFDTEDKREDSKPLSKGIRPTIFKSLVGKGHAEFSSNRQQDASEFLLHLLSMIQRNDRVTAGSDSHSLISLFQFQVEERIQCLESGQVRYVQRDDTIWQLPVAIEAATNKSEYDAWVKKKEELRAAKMKINPDDEVRAKVPFVACLEKFRGAIELSDFYSTAVRKISPARKTSRFATFPEYLVLQINRYYLADDWSAKKYDVEIDVPDELDLTSLRGRGKQPDEVQLPEGDPPAVNLDPVAVEIDEGIVVQLMSMGFDLEGCKKAVFNTSNQGVEHAMNWVLEHMTDEDFADPFVPPQSSTQQSTTSDPGEDAVAMVMTLGFTREQALKALKATGNSVERAADWVFSHANELDAMETETESNVQNKCPDGPGKYHLHGFISHMGTSTSCGHYVCHIRKEGRWVIFNDEKVAESTAPPTGHAYLYFYHRLSQ